MGLSDQLPRALRQLRIARRMTQEELAKAAGVGRSAINSYEVGRHLPRLDTLDRLLAVLEVDVAQLAATVSRLGSSAENPRGRYRAPGRSQPPPPRREQDHSHPVVPPIAPSRHPVAPHEAPQMSFMEELGLGLGRLREHRKLKLTEVAAAVGMNQSSLSRIERGQLQLKIETLGEILAALDADLFHLGLVVRLADSAPAGAFPEDTSEHHLLALVIAALGLEDVLQSIQAEGAEPEPGNTEES